jgi:hypothetical protein
MMRGSRCNGIERRPTVENGVTNTSIIRRRRERRGNRGRKGRSRRARRRRGRRMGGGIFGEMARERKNTRLARERTRERKGQTTKRRRSSANSRRNRSGRKTMKHPGQKTAEQWKGRTRNEEKEWERREGAKRSSYSALLALLSPCVFMSSSSPISSPSPSPSPSSPSLSVPPDLHALLPSPLPTIAHHTLLKSFEFGSIVSLAVLTPLSCLAAARRPASSPSFYTSYLRSIGLKPVALSMSLFSASCAYEVYTATRHSSFSSALHSRAFALECDLPLRAVHERSQMLAKFGSVIGFLFCRGGLVTRLHSSLILGMQSMALGALYQWAENAKQWENSMQIQALIEQERMGVESELGSRGRPN